MTGAEATKARTASLRVSVVIGVHNAVDVIGDCLQSLRAQRCSAIHEVIVADSSTDGTDRVVGERFPEVTLLRGNESDTLPESRARAIARASGDVIAILDPYSIADPCWSEAVRREHQTRPNLIIGGAVDLHEAHRQGLLAWARYINEYGMFMPPVADGTTEILPGSNLSYKRAAISQAAGEGSGAFWKTFVNERVAQSGSPLWLASAVLVGLKKPVPFGDFLRTRFDHGRCYAGMRVDGRSRRERWLRAVTAPALPIVLLARFGRRFWMKKRHRDKFLATLPLQLLLLGNWAVGEMVGYLLGPGQSCKKLFY